MNASENPVDGANGFVDFFTDVGKTLANKIINKQTNCDPSLEHKPISKVKESLTFRPVTNEEVRRYISRLKDTSASGIDDIQAVTIK